MTSQLPDHPYFGYGFVGGRFAVIGPDTIVDSDVKPDINAAVGMTVRFTPKNTMVKTELEPPTLFLKKSYEAVVGTDGYLVRKPAPGETTTKTRHIMLPTGVYNVVYSGSIGTPPPHQIEITEAHTEENYLDLVLAQPYTPPDNTIVQVVPLPSGGAPGQVYGWTGSGLGWFDPPVSTEPGPEGPPNTLSIGTVTEGPADADITGTAPNQTLNLVLPKGDPGAKGNPGDRGVQGFGLGPVGTLPGWHPMAVPSSSYTVANTSWANNRAYYNLVWISSPDGSPLEVSKFAIFVDSASTDPASVVRWALFPSTNGEDGAITKLFEVVFPTGDQSGSVIVEQAEVILPGFYWSANVPQYATGVKGPTTQMFEVQMSPAYGIAPRSSPGRFTGNALSGGRYAINMTGSIPDNIPSSIANEVSAMNVWFFL